MGKKINVVGAKPKKIEVMDRPKRRIEAAELAATLGAERCGQSAPGPLDPIALADLGTQLLHRLRSSGGRPALADATETCRVPLSDEDIQTLETMLAQIEEATGTKPSLGQLASVIVRQHLDARRKAPPSGAFLESPGKDRELSRTIVQQMIDLQIEPIREQLKRLEALLSSR
jgi:hypothetical protein